MKTMQKVTKNQTVRRGTRRHRILPVLLALVIALGLFSGFAVAASTTGTPLIPRIRSILIQTSPWI